MGFVVEWLWSSDNHTYLLFIAFAKPVVKARQCATVARSKGAGSDNSCRIASPADINASTSRKLQNRDTAGFFGAISTHACYIYWPSIYRRALPCLICKGPT